MTITTTSHDSYHHIYHDKLPLRLPRQVDMITEITNSTILLNHYTNIYRMKVITFEELYNYPNSDQWLHEEVSGKLLLTTITFKSKTSKFIKVTEAYLTIFLSIHKSIYVYIAWKLETILRII